MSKPRALLGEMFLNSRMITREQLDAALAHKPANKRIGQVLLESGFITENQLVQTLSLQLGVPWVSLSHIDFPRQFASIIPRDVAERHCCVPIFVRAVRGKGDFLYVATPDPLNEAALAELSTATRLPTRPMLATASEVRAAIRVFYMDAAAEAAYLAEQQRARESADALAPTTLREAKKSTTSPIVPSGTGSQPQITPGAATAPAATTPQGANPNVHPSGQFVPKNPALAKTWIEAESPTGVTQGTLPNKPEKIPQAATPARGSVPPPPTQASAKQDGAAHAGVPGQSGKMVALTLLDGTQVSLPSRAKRKSDIPAAETLSLRDLVAALRATAHGADATEILGDASWEPIVAALLAVLVKKGIVAEAEFMDEYKSV